MKRQEIVDAARQHLGTRWRHQARVPGVALDCLGLIVVTARDLGLLVEDTVNYSRRPNSRLLWKEVSRQLARVEGDEIKAGSVLLMHFSKDQNPYHFAFATSDSRMIHGYAKARKVVEHDIEDWLPSITAVFDFPGIED